jgi:hypothetical protein
MWLSSSLAGVDLWKIPVSRESLTIEGSEGRAALELASPRIAIAKA